MARVLLSVVDLIKIANVMFSENEIRNEIGTWEKTALPLCLVSLPFTACSSNGQDVQQSLPGFCNQ